MFEVGVVRQFEAAHSLEGDFGPATRLHGHTYKVQLSASGEALRPDGTLCDVTVLEGALDGVLAGLHLQHLNSLAPFARQNSTVEAVARFLGDEVARALVGQPVERLRVTVWESPGVFAAYESKL